MHTKADLLREIDVTDRRMRDLLGGLTDEQLAVPCDPGINPPIWELGHAAFFTEYFVLRALGNERPRMPGYDGIWDSFQIPHHVRWQEGVVPDKATTLGYYTQVLDELRERLAAKDPGPREHYLCRYAVYHQNMHLESMVWCRQTLGYPPPGSASPALPAAQHDVAGDVAAPGGTYPIGMPADAEFAFDNEKPGFAKELAPFHIAKTLVTNRDYAAFVEDGGYRKPDLWSYGGRCWLADEGVEHPLYWRPGWKRRWFDRWEDLPLDAPMLHVNFWEAEAFCSWAGRRLPTEYEWEAAARGAQGRLYPWGDAMDAARVDMDATHLARAPVTALPDGATPEGCLQMIGTAWEWTSSQFLPYDGFAVDMYPYMSTLQFGDHKVTKGGSGATSSCLVRSSYRQAYFPGRRDAFTGFRTCAR